MIGDWGLIAVVLALAVINAFRHRALGDNAITIKERVGAVLCVVFGLLLLAMYAQNNQNTALLILGLVCFVMGTQTAQVTSLRNRMTKLEQRLAASENKS